MLNSLKDKQGFLCLLLETANMRVPRIGEARHMSDPGRIAVDPTRKGLLCSPRDFEATLLAGNEKEIALAEEVLSKSG